ncbi:gamma-glutamylcyclotransferase, partial [Roseovarius sp. HI0049]
CTGVALKVNEPEEEQVLEYLRERELISSAYVEKVLPLKLTDGRKVQAVTYVIDAAHNQYCGGMPLEEQAQMIAHAVGGRGPNTEYLYNTTSHLKELGLEDADLEWLAKRVRQIVG